MDRITYFEYAYGSIEDLRKGDLEQIKPSSCIDRLDISNKGVIIIPRFIGVYQREEIKPDNQEEREELKGKRELMRKIEGVMNLVSRLCLEEEGKEESFHSDLIHIIYDSRVYNAKLVRELLGRSSGRIGVSSYNDMPDFNAKEITEMLDRLRKIADGIHYGIKTILMQEDREEFAELLRNDAQDGYSFLDSQLRNYGLTRVEYAFLLMMRKLKAREERKIETDPFLIELASKILEL